MKPSNTIRPGLLDELGAFDTPLPANTIGFIDPTSPTQFDLSGAIQSVAPPLAPTARRC